MVLGAIGQVHFKIMQQFGFENYDLKNKDLLTKSAKIKFQFPSTKVGLIGTRF